MEEVKEIPVIGIVQVLQMLKDGKTREDIRAHYSLSKSDLISLFKHPELIGKKTIKQKTPTFTIVADEDVKRIEDTDVKDVETANGPTMTIVEDTNKDSSSETKEEVKEQEEDKKSTWA